MGTAARVIITRPVQQAGQWVDALTAQGLHAQSFPLIEITGALSATQRADLHTQAAQVDVCMWVSSNAVGYFFQPNQAADQRNIAGAAIDSIVNSPHIRHWATGPGTVAALRQQGVNAQQIDAPDLQLAQWDSQALWQRVGPQVHAGSKVLILRGQDVGTPSASRDWLADQVRHAGGEVQFAAVYQRRAPQFSAQQVAWAQAAAQDGSIWVFSSSQAITHLPPVQGGWGRARCIVTHERIALAAQAQGFAVVCMSRPAIKDIAQSIKSLT